jgi:hypothetical protein
MRAQRAISLTLSAVVLGVSGLTAAPTALADSPQPVTVAPAEARDALASIPGLLAQSDATKVKTDVDSAAKTNVKNTVTDIPKDAEDGVTIGSKETPKLTISLPNAEQNGSGKLVAPGTVAYPSTGGSTNAVQATEDGGVRMLTVIQDRKAPTKYTYGISVPKGGEVKLQKDGSAIVTDRTGRIFASAARPWAKDANGKSVKTSFVVKGDTLTQVVSHRAKGVAYPVVADPWWVIVFWIVKCGTNSVVAVRYSGSMPPWLRWAVFVAGCLP